jgi:hypothetical protein
VIELGAEKMDVEDSFYYLSGLSGGLVIGIIIGFILAYALVYMSMRLIQPRPTGVVFNRDQQGNIVSITYV